MDIKLKLSALQDLPDHVAFVAPEGVEVAFGRRRGICRLNDGITVTVEGRDEVPEGECYISLVTMDEWGLQEGSSVKLAPIPWATAQSLELTPLLPLPEVALDRWKCLLRPYPLRAGGTITLRVDGQLVRFRVERVHPGGWTLITPSTDLRIRRPDPHATKGLQGYKAIGGLNEQVRQVRELVEYPLKYPEAFEKFGVTPPKGLLLYGPPGTGKTLIARAVAIESDAWFASLSGPEIIGKYYGESEERLRELFDQARQNAPSVIFIDEIDAIAPRRCDMGSTHQVERRVVSQLLTLMDGLSGRQGVVVLAATNLPDQVDPALRRPGRFDREVEVPPPDQSGRVEILAVHTATMPLASDVNLERLASRAYGFVGADLEALAKEAALSALRELLADEPDDAELSPRLNQATVTASHFDQAFRSVSPSATRALRGEARPAKWDDLVGLDEQISQLRQLVRWQLKNRRELARWGVTPPRGCLIVGPPGSGKTHMARCLAGEQGYNFIALRGPSLLARGLGETERGIREIFDTARRAAPSVLFIDEIDGLLSRQMGPGGPTAQFLVEMGGLEGNEGLFVLGCARDLNRLDDALLAPGRFERVITLPPLDRLGRLQLLSQLFRVRNLTPPSDLVELLSRFDVSGAGSLVATFHRLMAQALDSGVDLRGDGFANWLMGNR